MWVMDGDEKGISGKQKLKSDAKISNSWIIEVGFMVTVCSCRKSVEYIFGIIFLNKLKSSW